MLYDKLERKRIYTGSEPDIFARKDFFSKKVMITVWWIFEGLIGYSL